jgi:hypothetical protein
MPESLHDHCRRVIKAMGQGRVTPILGAGVNLYGRPPDLKWVPHGGLPNASELAGYLADKFDYPASETRDLLRVSQYAYVMSGSGPLYEALHYLFDADYPISPVYRFLAQFSRELEEADHPRRCQLIVTTNYDDGLERAFSEAGVPFDLVSYIADGDQRGKFAHQPPEGLPSIISKPNEYAELNPDEQTVILKIHGAVVRADSEGEGDSYVITEDHYIDYLTHTEIQDLVPIRLGQRLCKSHFLFLGYSMSDWNLRVLLHRIWLKQTLTYQPWAIQQGPSELDRKFWERRKVEIYDLSLEEYIPALEAALAELLDRRATP